MTPERWNALVDAIRTILVGIGGAFVAFGWTDANTVNGAIGALMVFLPGLYGVVGHLRS